MLPTALYETVCLYESLVFTLQTLFDHLMRVNHPQQTPLLSGAVEPFDRLQYRRGGLEERSRGGSCTAAPGFSWHVSFRLPEAPPVPEIDHRNSPLTYRFSW